MLAARIPAAGRALALAAATTLLAVPVLDVLASETQAATPRQSARLVLRLTDQRLDHMRAVMASKWVTRAPIEDLAQERNVLASVRADAVERGLRPDGVARVFVQQIETAKAVQLGWGSDWLMHGMPAGGQPPDLAAIRAELSALSARIVDALPGLDRLPCQRGIRAALLRDSRRLIRTRFVTDPARARLVDAMLGVRRVNSAPCRRRASA
jgi:chorismate mutase-like protein